MLGGVREGEEYYLASAPVAHLAQASISRQRLLQVRMLKLACWSRLALLTETWAGLQSLALALAALLEQLGAKCKHVWAARLHTGTQVRLQARAAVLTSSCW